MPKKVDYFATVYGRFRRGIVPHDQRVDETNVDELREMNFVFLSMDVGPAKKVIINRLRDSGDFLRRLWDGLDESRELPARDRAGDQRVARSIFDHIDQRISFGDITADEYDLNMQTADLNMLNAVLAVLRWKKSCGYYVDSCDERHTSFTVASNKLISCELSDEE